MTTHFKVQSGPTYWYCIMMCENHAGILYILQESDRETWSRAGWAEERPQVDWKQQ